VKMVDSIKDLIVPTQDFVRSPHDENSFDSLFDLASIVAREHGEKCSSGKKRFVAVENFPQEQVGLSAMLIPSIFGDSVRIAVESLEESNRGDWLGNILRSTARTVLIDFRRTSSKTFLPYSSKATVKNVGSSKVYSYPSRLMSHDEFTEYCIALEMLRRDPKNLSRFNKWDIQTQNEFITFLKKKNLDWYNYSIKMDNNELIDEFLQEI